jgi:hypothetical protein
MPFSKLDAIIERIEPAAKMSSRSGRAPIKTDQPNRSILGVLDAVGAVVDPRKTARARNLFQARSCVAAGLQPLRHW